jgi:hypothetical protein
VRSDEEIPLLRGIVRVGGTVRRPLKPGADYVHALLGHFERSGFDGAPRFHGIDSQGREILSFVEGFVPPHNGFQLDEDAVRAGARLIRRVHDLTEVTEFATGSEVACHPNLSQPNFVFRDWKPVAIIDWDGTSPGTKVRNFGEFLWAFVHPAMYGDGEPAARMLQAAADAYGWPGGPLVDSMLDTVRAFQDFVAGDREAEEWAATELAYLEQNVDVFRAYLEG